METQNLVISFDYSWFLAKNLAYAECWIMKFHYRNSSNEKFAIWNRNLPKQQVRHWYYCLLIFHRIAVKGVVSFLYGLTCNTFTVVVITKVFFKERPNIPELRKKNQIKQITYLSVCTEIDSHKTDVKRIKWLSVTSDMLNLH